LKIYTKKGLFDSSFYERVILLFVMDSSSSTKRHNGQVLDLVDLDGYLLSLLSTELAETVRYALLTKQTLLDPAEKESWKEAPAEIFPQSSYWEDVMAFLTIWVSNGNTPGATALGFGLASQQEQQQQQQQQQQQFSPQHPTGPLHPRPIAPQFLPPMMEKNHADVNESFAAMRDTKIVMPLDLLSDERNLYSIMPYCDGGELFERLDLNERFSEAEARYWMDQVLNGLENLQKVGICHRDMSLENLLVHKDGALIIDMGMCLLVPYCDEDPGSLTTSFDNMNMNGGQVAQHQQFQSCVSRDPISGRLRRRSLIKPQGTCGKWIYMSPEVYRNEEPFDGFAVDMWAAGVILFLMLTGFPPWERACRSDERFHYMSGGYLVQMLTEWDIGLSSDAMDLLQRMLFLDPKDRLSLEQVRAHPWMVNGHREHPLGLQR